MNETDTIRTEDPFRAAFLMSKQGELILAVRRPDCIRFVIKGPGLKKQNDLFDSETLLIHLPVFRNHLRLVEELHRAHFSRLETEWSVPAEPEGEEDELSFEAADPDIKEDEPEDMEVKQ